MSYLTVSFVTLLCLCAAVRGHGPLEMLEIWLHHLRAVGFWLRYEVAVALIRICERYPEWLTKVQSGRI